MDQTTISTTNPDAGSGDIISRIEAILSPPAAPAAEDPAKKKPSVEETEESTQVTEQAASESEEGEETEGSEEHPSRESASEESEALELEAEQLAHVLGLPEDKILTDEDGNLVFLAKVDDQTSRVKLNDLLASYQLQSVITKKSQALADERRSFEEQRKEKESKFEAAIGEAAAVSKLLEQQLTQAYNNIDWNALRISNPAEWSAKQQEFTRLAQHINAVKESGKTLLSKYIQEKQGEETKLTEQRMIDEYEKLQTALPAWTDKTVAAKEFSELQEFLSSEDKPYAFAPEEVGNVTDHRLILLARDAMKYRALSKKGTAAVKKVKALPKLVKSGGRTAVTAAAKAGAEQRKVRLKKTGSVQDLAAVLIDRI